MATSNKDTIYIDIDDEITGIIDKVKGSDSKVVCLVLPKRATVFQSIVNMKLLKRAADSSKKNLVLITSEAGLLPLAGAAGVHVAKTLTSKPEIPAAPLAADDAEETVTESDEPLDSSQSVGALAGAAASSPVSDDGVETLILDDEDLPPEADAPKTFAPPPKKNKKLAVPNFERFRLLLIGGALLLILLIGGLIYALTALPKAVINIKTDATSVDTSLGLTLSPAAKELNEETLIVPAKVVQQQKTLTQQVPTTGQKNNGNKASGSVSLLNCSTADGDVTVPAGTGLSSNGNTYITLEAVTLPESEFNNSRTRCTSDDRVSVDVLAQNGGSSYNLPSGATFSVAGFSGVSGRGDPVSGGTDSIVQTVNQNDINNAKAKINTADDNIKKELIEQLSEQNYRAIEATYNVGDPSVTPSANVGDVASTVTVTSTVTYTMYGAKQADLKKLVDNEIKTQIDTTKQGILSDGLDKAVFNVDSVTPTEAKVTMSTTATAGPDLDIAKLKEDAAGQKPGPIKDELQSNPDVTSVGIKLSPFWVSSIPKKQDRIFVNIAEPERNKANNSADNP